MPAPASAEALACFAVTDLQDELSRADQRGKIGKSDQPYCIRKTREDNGLGTSSSDASPLPRDSGARSRDCSRAIHPAFYGVAVENVHDRKDQRTTGDNE